MKVKMVVFNDRRVPMHLNIQDTNYAETNRSNFKRIPEGRLTVVEYEIPEGSVPYLKVWETGQALLSYIAEESLGSFNLEEKV